MVDQVDDEAVNASLVRRGEWVSVFRLFLGFRPRLHPIADLHATQQFLAERSQTFRLAFLARSDQTAQLRPTSFTENLRHNNHDAGRECQHVLNNVAALVRVGASRPRLAVLGILLNVPMSPFRR